MKSWKEKQEAFLQARVAEVIPNGYFIDWDDGAKKTPLFEPFIYNNEHFTKIGSGQT
jgi:hypothetical protein